MATRLLLLSSMACLASAMRSTMIDLSSSAHVHQTNMNHCKQTFEQIEDELADVSTWAANDISRDTVEFSLQALKLYINSFNAAVHFLTPDSDFTKQLAAVHFLLGEYQRSFHFERLLCASLPSTSEFTETELRVQQMGKRIQEKCADVIDTKKTTIVLNMTLTSAMSMACARLRRPAMQPYIASSSSLLEDHTVQQRSETSVRAEAAHMMTVEMKSSMIKWVMSEQHRVDMVEAMVPGMSSALDKVFGEVGTRRSSSTALAETNASVSPSANLEKVRTLIKNTHWRDQYPGLYAEHPMLTNSPLRLDYKNAKCLGVPENKLVTESDSLFSKDIIDGCSSPIYLPYFDVITPVCFGHDACLNCKQHEGLSYCHDTFYNVINARCSSFYTSWRDTFHWSTCKAQATVMWVAVSGWGTWYTPNPKPWCDSSDGGSGENICAKLISEYDADSMARVDPYI